MEPRNHGICRRTCREHCCSYLRALLMRWGLDASVCVHACIYVATALVLPTYMSRTLLLFSSRIAHEMGARCVCVCVHAYISVATALVHGCCTAGVCVKVPWDMLDQEPRGLLHRFCCKVALFAEIWTSGVRSLAIRKFPPLLNPVAHV